MDTFNASHENTFFAMSTWFQNILFKENEKIQLQNRFLQCMHTIHECYLEKWKII